MNYPTNSNIGDVLFLNSLATTGSYVRPRQIEIYGNVLLESADLIQTNYEHLDEGGLIAELPLTKTEIMEVVMMRLHLHCEEYLKDIADQSVRDRVLKQMIERQVKLKTKQAA